MDFCIVFSTRFVYSVLLRICSFWGVLVFGGGGSKASYLACKVVSLLIFAPILATLFCPILYSILNSRGGNGYCYS